MYPRSSHEAVPDLEADDAEPIMEGWFQLFGKGMHVDLMDNFSGVRLGEAKKKVIA